ncbi:MAG: N-acetylglucosamine-6-phosphate deacetylase [Clostridiales bacterium]|nr:N-acetylglucosamine-6-phosphate deacetylase [Clostridiales bacterium]
MKTVIRGARVILPDSVKITQVIAQGSKILEITDHYDPMPEDRLIEAENLYLCPGFVDIHVHGGGGASVNSGSAQAVLDMARAHAGFGTTSLLPTTLAAPMPQLLGAISAVREASSQTDGPTILGIHLEGPCLNPLQSGAQAPGSLLTPAEAELGPLFDAWPGGIKMMGAAPELDGGMELGDELTKRGITASVAHSNATYYEVQEAINHGYSDVTHLYSSCSGLVRVNSYRIPGVIEAGLNLDELTVQVIADGKHLPLELLKLIYRCKGAEKIELITDGLEFAASELKEGTVYRQENGVETVYEDGVMKLLSRQAFAGSVATLHRCVRNMVKAGVPLPEAVRMASENPARRIGAKGKGRIKAGFDADLVLLDKELAPVWVMARGKTVKDSLSQTTKPCRG